MFLRFIIFFQNCIISISFGRSILFFISFDREYLKFLTFQNCEWGHVVPTEDPTEAYGSLRKAYGNPTEILERFSGEILRKNLRKSYGNMRKLPHENQKKSGSSLNFILRKQFLLCGSPTEALRKPCGSPAEALRKAFRKSELLRKLPRALIYNNAPLHPSYSHGE